MLHNQDQNVEKTSISLVYYKIYFLFTLSLLLKTLLILIHVIYSQEKKSYGEKQFF